MPDIYTNYLDHVEAPSNYSGNYSAGMQAMVNTINQNFLKLMSEPVIRGDAGTSVRTREEYMWDYDGQTFIITELGVKILDAIYGEPSGNPIDAWRDLNNPSIIINPIQAGVHTYIDIFGPDVYTDGLIPHDAFKQYNDTLQRMEPISKDSFYFINPDMQSRVNVTTGRPTIDELRVPIRCFVTDETRKLKREFFCTFFNFFDARETDLERLYNNYIGQQRTTTPTINSQFDIWYDRTCAIYGTIDETAIAPDNEWKCEYYTITPKLYWQSDIERFCWQLNGVRTGVSAQGLRGDGGQNANIRIVAGVPNTMDSSEYAQADQVEITHLLEYDSIQDEYNWRAWQTGDIAEGDLLLCYVGYPNANNSPITPPDYPYAECVDIFYGFARLASNGQIVLMDLYHTQTYRSVLESLYGKNLIFVGYSNNTARTWPNFPRGYVLRHGDILANNNPPQATDKVGMLYSEKGTGNTNNDIRLSQVNYDQTYHTVDNPTVNGLNNETRIFTVDYNTTINGRLHIDGIYDEGNSSQPQQKDYSGQTVVENIIIANDKFIQPDYKNGINVLRENIGYLICEDNCDKVGQVINPPQKYVGDKDDLGSVQVKSYDFSQTPAKQSAKGGAITATVGSQMDVYLGCPIGTVIMYAGPIPGYEDNTNPYNTEDVIIVEKDWLLCNGATISYSQSNKQFKKLIDLLNKRNGSTIPFVTLPDFILKFPIGANCSKFASNTFPTNPEAGFGNQTYLTATGGEERHQLKYNELAIQEIKRINANDSSTQWKVTQYRGTNGGAQVDAINAEPHNNIPPYYAINFIIKYR